MFCVRVRFQVTIGCSHVITQITGKPFLDVNSSRVFPYHPDIKVIVVAHFALVPYSFVNLLGVTSNRGPFGCGKVTVPTFEQSSYFFITWLLSERDGSSFQTRNLETMVLKFVKFCKQLCTEKKYFKCVTC